MAEKVLLSLLFGGTEVVIDMGRWIEKNEATWTSKKNITVSYRASYTHLVCFIFFIFSRLSVSFLTVRMQVLGRGYTRQLQRVGLLGLCRLAILSRTLLGRSAFSLLYVLFARWPAADTLCRRLGGRIDASGPVTGRHRGLGGRVSTLMAVRRVPTGRARSRTARGNGQEHCSRR